MYTSKCFHTNGATGYWPMAHGPWPLAPGPWPLALNQPTKNLGFTLGIQKYWAHFNLHKSFPANFCWSWQYCLLANSIFTKFCHDSETEPEKLPHCFLEDEKLPSPGKRSSQIFIMCWNSNNTFTSITLELSCSAAKSSGTVVNGQLWLFGKLFRTSSFL